MLAQGQSEMAIVFYDFPSGRHRAQHGNWLALLGQDLGLPPRGGCKKRQWFVPERLDRPKRLASRETERRPEGISLGEFDQSGGGNASTAPEVVDRGEGAVFAAGHKARRFSVPEPLDHSQTEPDRETTIIGVRRFRMARSAALC